MNTKSSSWLFIAASSGLLAVILGAFGAHSLSSLLPANELIMAKQWWTTATFYHFVHTLLLLLISHFMNLWHSKWLSRAAVALLVGIFIFSGSLYLMALVGLTWLGAITPIGGLLLILGWLFLMLASRDAATASGGVAETRSDINE